MRDAIKRVSITEAARVSGARDRFKIIPECVRETDLHPDPPATVLRCTLNFPRAALGRGEEKEELTLSELSLSFFLSGRHLFPLLTEKKLAGSCDSPRLLFLDT